MKCLLLLLALGLVTSDKLDRTYLPPPGAKYSGGTLDDLNLPLEFPQETITGTIVNGPLVGTYPDMSLIGDPNNQVFKNGLSTVPIDYSTSTLPNDLIQTTEYPLITNEFQSIFPTLKPVSSFYSNFPPKSPSYGYLPSKQSTVGTQSYPVLNSNPEIKSVTNTNNFRPGVDQKSTGYYYVPTMQTYNNGITNQRPSDESSTDGYIQFPNQVKNGNLVGNGQTYIPTTRTTNYIVDNYQPGAFGFYGGNPMIMSSQNSLPQEFGSMKLTPQLGGNENNIRALFNQGKFKDNMNTSVRPFQTPLVRLNSKNALKPTDSKTTTIAPNILPLQFSTATTKSFSNDNVPAALNQRNGIPVRTRFRQERPQVESERNAVIINYENSISPEGYSYSYDTSNGIHADESGIATNGVRAKGSYSYTGDDGKIYTVTYTADENGFQPRGDHLPTAPPIPEAIQKVLDQATRDTIAGIIDDGSYDDKKYGHMNYQGAMDRYNQFKKNNNKVSRLNGAKRKQSESLQNKNKNEFHNMPLHNNDDLKTNEKANDSLNNHDTNQIYSQKNELNGKNTLDTGSRSNFKEHNQNKELMNKPNRKLITSVTDKQITKTERVMFRTQNPNVNDKPIINNVGISNTITRDQVSQKIIPVTSSRVTYTDDGYYYVPPIIPFNPKTEKLDYEKNLYLTTSKPISKTIEAETNKPIGFDRSQKRKDDYEDSNSTQLPLNLKTVATEKTRQPYISGPVDQVKPNYFNNLLDVTAESARNNPATYPNNLGSSLLGFNTTPMTAQIFQESQPLDEYSQYYQPTTNPTVFDQTLPSAVENRVNIPSGYPGITVSQDFVTTTYRPSISGDGVLEVNQNVKIYGIGRPETSSVNNGYIYKVPDDNNNGLYSPTIPDGNSNNPGVYRDSFNTEPVQDGIFQGISNKNIPYGNKYLTTGAPGTDATGPNSNVSFDGQSQGYIPKVNSNVFGNPELLPGQELPIPIISIEKQDPGRRIIGEDFSGPKQPQNFDPETGYYYK